MTMTMTKDKVKELLTALLFDRRRQQIIDTLAKDMEDCGYSSLGEYIDKKMTEALSVENQQQQHQEETLRRRATEILHSGCPFEGAYDKDSMIEFLSEEGGVLDLKPSELTPSQRALWNVIKMMHRRWKARYAS